MAQPRARAAQTRAGTARPFGILDAARAPRHSPDTRDMSTAPFVRIAELPAHAGQTVTVRGWVTHLRSSGKVAFAVLRDGTGICQAVFVKNQLAAGGLGAVRRADAPRPRSTITGEVRAEPRAPGGYEIGVTDLTIIGASPIDYPIQPKEHGIDFLLDNRHFWLRSHRVSARSSRSATRSSRRSTTSSTSAASCASTRRSSRRRSASAAGCSRPSTSTKGTPTSRRPGSSTARRRRRRSGRSTPSARPSAPRSRRRAATSPSSG